MILEKNSCTKEHCFFGFFGNKTISKALKHTCSVMMISEKN